LWFYITKGFALGYKYDHYKALGLPIGSGMIESACKWIVQQRFKGVGMYWSMKPFYTTKQTSDHIVLGISLVNEIVKKCNMKIKVESIKD